MPDSTVLLTFPSASSVDLFRARLASRLTDGDIVARSVCRLPGGRRVVLVRCWIGLVAEVRGHAARLSGRSVFGHDGWPATISPGGKLDLSSLQA